MTLETVLNRTARTLDLESLTHCLVQCFCREALVLWRDIEGLRIGVIRKRVLDVEFIAGSTDESYSVRAGAESPINRQFREVFGIVGLHLNPLWGAPKSKMEIRGTLERCGGSETVRQRMFCRAAQRKGVTTN